MMEKCMVEEFYLSQTEKDLMEHSRKDQLKDLEHISLRMVKKSKEFGRMEYFSKIMSELE